MWRGHGHRLGAGGTEGVTGCTSFPLFYRIALSSLFTLSSVTAVLQLGEKGILEGVAGHLLSTAVLLQARVLPGTGRF